MRVDAHVVVFLDLHEGAWREPGKDLGGDARFRRRAVSFRSGLSCGTERHDTGNNGGMVRERRAKRRLDVNVPLET